jgi:ABC-type transport system substrate-binding protein
VTGSRPRPGHRKPAAVLAAAVLAAAVLAAAVLATAACGTGESTGPPARPSTVAARPSGKPAAPTPTYADPARGSSTSVVKLYSYDAVAHSAVVEPIVFLDGAAYCKKFQVKPSDPRCVREWTSEESHTKITVAVSRKPTLNAWDDGQDGDCIGTITSGGVCPVSASRFAAWLEENPAGFAVITTRDGTITKIAEMYTP